MLKLRQLSLTIWHGGIFLFRLIGCSQLYTHSLRLSGWVQLGSVAGPLDHQIMSPPGRYGGHGGGHRLPDCSD